MKERYKHEGKFLSNCNNCGQEQKQPKLVLIAGF